MLHLPKRFAAQHGADAAVLHPLLLKQAADSGEPACRAGGICWWRRNIDMRRTFLAWLWLAGAAPATAAPVCDGAITDALRGRSIPVRVRMPEGSLAKAPVILFSHGLGGSVDAGTDFARRWVEAGFLVIHVQHPGSDSAVWRGAANPRAALLPAANARQLQARVADMGRVADAVAAGRVMGACNLARGDAARLGAAGHSFGAHTVLALAGQRFGPMGAALADPRFIAVAALSPMSPQSSASTAAAAFGAIRVPLLTATGSRDGSPLARDQSLAEVVAARSAVFTALPDSQSGRSTVGLWVEGADHAAFGGNARPRRPNDPRVTALVAETTTAFFTAQLGGSGTPDLHKARALLHRGDRIEVK
jgi:dienelactone hydrolase